MAGNKSLILSFFKHIGRLKNMAYGNIAAALSAFQVICAGNAEQRNGISGFERQNTAVVFQEHRTLSRNPAGDFPMSWRLCKAGAVLSH